MIVLLALGCVHRPPAPLLPPPPEIELPPARVAAWEPGMCRGDDVSPGVPLDCDGIAISVAQADRVELQVADLRLVSRWLLEERDGRLMDRALHEDERLRLHRTVADLEAEARAARLAVPLAALGGGLAVGGLVYAGLRLGAAVP